MHVLAVAVCSVALALGDVCRTFIAKCASLDGVFVGCVSVCGVVRVGSSVGQGLDWCVSFDAPVRENLDGGVGFGRSSIVFDRAVI